MRSLPEPMAYPKIELHVHLDSAMRPSLLLRLARRNGYVLTFATSEEFAGYCQVKRFEDLGSDLARKVWRAQAEAGLPGSTRGLRGGRRNARERCTSRRSSTHG